MPSLPVRVELAGVDVSSRVVWESTRIHDHLNAEPNTAELAIRGGAPSVGQTVRIGLGSFAPADLIFAGTVQALGQSYLTTNARPPGNTIWPCTLVDWTFSLNQRRPFGEAVGASATAIAQAIVTAYAPGFTSAGVVAGLPAVSVVFDGREDFMTCLRQLATLVGGYTDVDYSKDVKLFLTDPGTPPAPVDQDHPPLNSPPITFQIDGSQVRNRVYGKGHSESTLVDLPASASIVPIGDTAQFSVIGGKAIAGTRGDSAQSNRLTYTGIERGTAKSAVVGEAVGAPASPPSPTLAVGVAGDLLGAYQWKVAYMTAAGESLPSPASGGLTVAPVAAPNPFSVSDAGLLGRLIGPYGYRATFVTAKGETLGGTAAGLVQAAQPAPAAPASFGQTDGGPLNGTYLYKVGLVSPYGETLSAASGAQVVAPTATATPGLTLGGQGTVLDPYYGWVATWVDADGKESTESAAVTTFQGGLGGFTTWTSATITQPASRPASAIRWRIYRTKIAGGTPGPRLLLRDLPIATTSYNDTVGTGPSPDTSLGQAAPNPGTMGKTITLSSLATGPAGTTARNVYRTASGGSTYYLVGQLGDNTTTTFVDRAVDAALVVLAPIVNLNGRQTLLSGIPTGPAGTLARRIYRTKVGSVEYYLLAELSDNTTTTFTDNVADDAIGAVRLPIVSTADGGAVSLTLPTGPAGTTQRIVYRTKAGGVDFFYVASVIDNTTTTLVDNRGDDTLGRAPATTAALAPVFAGVTSVLLVSAAGFPAAGWFIAGNQIVRYSGKTGNTLTGIPASGAGALLASLPAGSDISPAPALLGVTGNTAAMAKGSRVSIWIERNDLAAQAEAAAITGGDGIREYLIDDDTKDEASLTALCDADLETFSRPIVSVTYATFDLNAVSGRSVTVDLNAGTGMFDSAVFDPAVFDVFTEFGAIGPTTFTIQSVDITFDRAATLFPRRLVHASAVNFTLQNLLQRVQLAA